MLAPFRRFSVELHSHIIIMNIKMFNSMMFGDYNSVTLWPFMWSCHFKYAMNWTYWSVWCTEQKNH